MSKHSKRERDYVTLKIPPELAKEIDEIIKNHPELGYRSRAEFVKEAIRKHILTHFSKE